MTKLGLQNLLKIILKQFDHDNRLGLLIGYQEEDLDIQDPSSFLCILGHTVLNQDEISVEDHNYVFSPEVVEKKAQLKLCKFRRVRSAKSGCFQFEVFFIFIFRPSSYLVNLHIKAVFILRMSSYFRLPSFFIPSSFFSLSSFLMSS